MLPSETYGGGQQRKKRLSRAELQKIKKNMKKVPVIQQKSAIYHQSEAQKAEEILESALKSHHHDVSVQKSVTDSSDKQSHTRYQDIWTKITKFLGL